MNWNGKEILVLGLGDTGLSVARWAARSGARIRFADSRRAPPGLAALGRLHAGIDAHLGPFTDALFRHTELVLASPGVATAGPACDPAIARAKAAGAQIIGDVELFARELAEERKLTKVLGITGSNGKSTVTAMAGEMCRAAGLKTVVAGNIGVPILDALGEVTTTGMPDAWVIELSSFQLETTASLACDAATMLNLSQDHLDRYASMTDYAAAKKRIFANAGVQVLNRDDEASMLMRSVASRMTSFGLGSPVAEGEFGLCENRAALCEGETKFIALQELRVTGMHNAANALAAAALVRAIGVPREAVGAGLRGFTGLPHRTELVGEIAAVKFFDDSKGTNVGSTVAALNGMTERVVLIAGGEGKGQNFAPLLDAVRARARAVVLIGSDAAAIESVLKHAGVPLLRATSMQDAVGKAHQSAKAGDAVLLSPACASFDMFENYRQRGQVFAACVTALAKAEAR